MTRYLLDTDTLSHAFREPSGTVARRIAEVGEQAVATTPIVAGEFRRVAGLGVEDWREALETASSDA